MSISMNDLVGQAKVSTRLNDTTLFNGVIAQAEAYTAYSEKLNTIDMAKVSSSDKQDLFNKLEKHQKQLDQAFEQVGHELLKVGTQAQQMFETSIKPTPNDFALAGLLQGKSAPELLEVAHSSPAAARLLHGSDAGKMAGLDSEAVASLAKYAAPKSFAEVERVNALIDSAGKLKATATQAHQAQVGKFHITHTENKVLDALND
ncbi:hypothetical protein ST37_08310 [Vibrio sp. qd031]|uniref:hypothetical protein n=1 Tax=Vibrio sp. qd031 TaxID=1603038 RepID=UPI000A10EF15|nr:hypothetical protein [Vibrio sp. qd031]ORT50712.1 hypothetical protein ST37_08310 [Vibrio sp. qd031]